MNTEYTEFEGVSFEEMSIAEIEEQIVKYVREQKKLEEDRKDFNGGVKEALKELKGRTALALSTIDKKKLTGDK